VATPEACEKALRVLAVRLDERESQPGDEGFDRSLSCNLRDLDITFAGRLHGGKLVDIRRCDDGADAQVRLDMTSDDLVSLVDGDLNMATAWATGRVKVRAGVMDLVRLRAIF
jgi:putative sterol carrier protein